MALKICFECGHKVSSEARRCPNCGYKCNKGVIDEVMAVIAKEFRENTRGCLILILLAIVLIFVVRWVIGYL